MRTLRILISGYGGIGRAFAGLLNSKRDQLVAQYGLSLPLVAVTTGHGAAVAQDGLPLDALLVLGRKDSPALLEGYGSDATTVSLIERGVADVLIETTPTDIKTGEPGMTHLRTALEHRMHVVTATKGPLVLAFPTLRHLAEDRGVALKFSSATAAALPAFDLGAYCLAGTTIQKIEGTLNGTTNFILTRMARFDESYANALAEAQLRGIAEPNPTLDVEGWDSANKLVIIANSVLGAELTLDQVSVSGITNITPELLKSAATEGKTLKLIARAEVIEGRVEASVGVHALPLDHPLAHVTGSEKGITYTTDTMDKVSAVGGKSDPRAAAAAMLKDVINLAREYSAQPLSERERL